MAIDRELMWDLIWFFNKSTVEFSMQLGLQTLLAPLLKSESSSTVSGLNLFSNKPLPQAKNSNISVTFTEAKGETAS